MEWRVRYWRRQGNTKESVGVEGKKRSTKNDIYEASMQRYIKVDVFGD